MENMHMENVFKICPKCGFEWKNRESFLADQAVSIIGYQVNFDKLETGFFLFNHTCKGTFGIYVYHFRDLYSGEIFTERATGSNDCMEYCLKVEMLDSCPAKCECAFVREIIQKLKK